MVIIGTIARSWNSRIEKAFSPKGELIRPELLRLGSTCAVEESASGRPRTSAACQLNPRVTRISAVRISPVTTDRKSVVEGKSVSVSVDLGGRRLVNKKNIRRKEAAQDRTNEKIK